MFIAIDDHPAVVGAPVSGAMRVMNAGCELVRIREESLAVGKDLGVGRRGDHTVEIVVRHDFDELAAAVGEMRQNGVHMMAAVSASRLITRRARCEAADHDVINIGGRSGSQQSCEPGVDSRRTTRWNGNIVGRSKRSAKQQDGQEERQLAHLSEIVICAPKRKLLSRFRTLT